MSRKWATKTFEGLDDFNPDTDLFVPLMFYADKTGTDKYQRYPLEPWMFTTPILRQFARENAKSWRHLGFIPPTEDVDIGESERNCDDKDGEAVSSDSHCKTKAQSNLQHYHDCLSAIFTELRECFTTKPWMYVNFGE